MSLRKVISESTIKHGRFLLLEVTKGKREVLLKKVVGHMYGDNETLHDLIMDYIDEFPIAVERAYGEMDKIGMFTNDNIREFFESRIDLDEVKEIASEHVDKNYMYLSGLMGLVACIKLFKGLEEADPTGNMKYGNWLVDVVLPYSLRHQFDFRSNAVAYNISYIGEENGRFWEDIPKLHAYLEAFNEMKKKNELPDKYKDINQIQPLRTTGGDYTQDPINLIGGITKKYRTVSTGDYFEAVEEHLKEGRDYEVLFDGTNHILYKPLTQKANSILGMDTEWCTTYGEHCTNPDYQDRTPASYEDLHIIVNKDDPDEKYQIDFDSGQFMDQNDSSVNEEIFFKKYDEVARWFLKNKSEEFYGFKNVLPSIFKKNQDILVEKMLSGDSEDWEVVAEHAWEALMDATPELMDALFSDKINGALLDKFSRTLYYALRWNANDVYKFFIGKDESEIQLDRGGRANISGYVFERNGNYILVRNYYSYEFFKYGSEREALKDLIEFYKEIPEDSDDTHDRGQLHLGENFKEVLEKIKQ